MADEKKQELYQVAQAIVKYIEKAEKKVVLPATGKVNVGNVKK